VTFFIFMLLGIAAIVWYRITTPEERKDHFARAWDALGELKEAVTRPRPAADAFRRSLRARMRFALITPAMALVIIGISGRMLYGAGAVGNPDTLVAWGASLGTRTTNGEWWRLVTATFLHTGILHLIVDLAVLMQLGLILERLVGRVTLVAVYLSAGMFDGLITLSSHPVAVAVSSSGAIFGLYGLLLATLIWQTFHAWRRRPVADAEESINPVDTHEPVEHDLRIPLIAMKRVAIVAVLFITYSAVTGRAGTAQFTGLLVGMMYGVIFARRAIDRVPKSSGVAFAVVATAAIVVIAAVGIGNIADVKPELARVLELEESTSATYQSGVDQLRKGRISAEAVAELAEGTIVSELKEADGRLEALTNVPPEHQSAVADAREYLRLRCASWRARGIAIRRSHGELPRKPDGADDTAWRLQLHARFRSDEAARGNAEGTERASLEALQRVARFMTTSHA
jgi:membrane associated rhomboid family serine protease